MSFSLTSCFSRCSEVSTSPPSPGQSQFSHDKQTTQHNNPHMLLLPTWLPTTHLRQRSASFLPQSLHRTSSTSWVSSPVRGIGKIKPGNIHTCTVFQLLQGASTGSLSQRDLSDILCRFVTQPTASIMEPLRGTCKRSIFYKKKKPPTANQDLSTASQDSCHVHSAPYLNPPLPSVPFFPPIFT